MQRNPFTGKLDSKFDESNYYVIEGSGFGVKNLQSIYENFDSLTGGVGALDVVNSGGVSLDSSIKYSGSKSIRCEFLIEDFPKIFAALQHPQKVYASFRVRYSGDPTYTNVWKFGRIGAGAIYSGIPHALSNFTAAEVSGWLPYSNGSVVAVASPANGSWSGNMTDTVNPNIVLGEWMTFQYWFDAGTVGNSDFWFKEQQNDLVTSQWVDKEYLSTGGPSLPEWFITPMDGYPRNSALGAPPASLIGHMDEVYISQDPKYIVFSDTAILANATKTFVGNDFAWHDDKIWLAKNIGRFNVGDTVYCHIHNDSGAVAQVLELTL
jgi:hypothetical protein